MIRIAYLSETIRIRDQRMSDAIPVMVSGDGVPPASAAYLKA